MTPPRPLGPGALRVFVGAPGVGKTTSLAKLAARNEEGERDVGLATMDAYRVGGAEGLRRYAELLEVPFREVESADSIRSLCEATGPREWMIDTTGRDATGAAALDALLPLRDRLGDRACVELVIDGTSRLEVARQQRARFAALRPDRLLISKVDECENLAVVANLLLDSECPPISWLGTGQRVPDDIVEVSSARLWPGLSAHAA